MSEKLKSVVFWTIYLFCVVLLLIGYIIPIYRLIVLKEKSETLVNLMNWSSIGLSLLSLALGVISISVSSRDEKESTHSLNSILEIQQESKKTLAEIKSISENIKSSQEQVIAESFASLISTVQNAGAIWARDNTGKKE